MDASIKRLLIIALACACLIVLVPAVIYAGSIGYDLSNISDEWNKFGGFYGGLTGPLLSFLAIALVVIGMFRQEGQIRSLSYSNEMTHAEGVVGGLLDALESIVGGITFFHKGRDRVGRRAFLFLYTGSFQNAYKKYFRDNEDAKQGSSIAVADAYGKFYGSRGSYVGHYFRTIYTIVKTIDMAPVTSEDKQTLMSWLTCRLSRFELILLFYNCLSDLGNRKFKPLIEKYGLLEHLDAGLLLDASHIGFYSPAAYLNPSG